MEPLIKSRQIGLNEQNVIQITERNSFRLNGLGGSLGFVISDDKLILGYIDKNGELCKLMEPIDLSELSNEKFTEIIKRIPTVTGFSELSLNFIGVNTIFGYFDFNIQLNLLLEYL